MSTPYQRIMCRLQKEADSQQGFIDGMDRLTAEWGHTHAARIDNRKRAVEKLATVQEEIDWLRDTCASARYGDTE